MDLAPKEIHLHIRRYPISEVPTEEEKLKEWIFQCWKEKDELVDHFKQHQRFPSSKEVNDVVTYAHALEELCSHAHERHGDRAEGTRWS
jgi:hypothetical protein